MGHCADGCLYSLRDDPLELHDLAAAMPERVAKLRAKVSRPAASCSYSRTSAALCRDSPRPGLCCAQVEAYEATAFNPHRGSTNPAACHKALSDYRGFWGPFLE